MVYIAVLFQSARRLKVFPSSFRDASEITKIHVDMQIE